MPQTPRTPWINLTEQVQALSREERSTWCVCDTRQRRHWSSSAQDQTNPQDAAWVPGNSNSTDHHVVLKIWSLSYYLYQPS